MKLQNYIEIQIIKNQPLRGRDLRGSWPCGSTILGSRLRRACVHKLMFCVAQDTFCCGTVFVKVDMVSHVESSKT